MRTLLVIAIFGACCLFVGANTSAAADHGQVPASMLAQMGLGGMQPMSDVQGLAIRGMGRRLPSIQANVVVQSNQAGNAGNGGAGGVATASTSSATANGGSGGSVNGTNFNNNTAAFIQVNVGRLRLGGIF